MRCDRGATLVPKMTPSRGYARYCTEMAFFVMPCTPHPHNLRCEHVRERSTMTGIAVSLLRERGLAGANDQARCCRHKAKRLPSIFAACLAVISSGSVVAPTLAADLPPAVAPPPPVVEQELVFSATLYGWASGISGRMRTLPPLPAVHVNIGFDKVLQNLNGALMASER
jgi:hypothetical protein